MSPLFSDQDSDLLSEKWNLNRDGYARRIIRAPSTGKFATIFAHHEICIRAFGRRPDWSKREVCDHINGKTTDNTRENLRIVPMYDNTRNSPHHKTGCVTWHKQSKRFQVQFLGRYIGLFKTEDEARSALAELKQGATK